MKKVRNSCFKGVNSIIGLLLSILGFVAASCDTLDEYGTPAAEYGAPYATYKVSGTVSDETSEPISGIEVVLAGEYDGISDTAYTDDEGAYELSIESTSSDEIPLSFNDVDGVDNGYFEDVDTVANFSDVEFTGGESWYKGEGEVVFDIELKETEE